MTHPEQHAFSCPLASINYRGPMTEEFLFALRQRNAKRLEAEIVRLGSSWLLYSHRPDLRRIP